MIKEGKFGVSEAISLTTITIFAKVFFSSASILAKDLGTTSWYMTIISAATAAVGFTVIYLLLKRFPEKDIVQIYELSLGKVFGFIFSFILILYLLFLAATYIREFTEILKIYILPKSPPEYIVVIFLSVVMCMAYLGLEPLARLSKLIANILFMGLALLLVLCIQNYEIHKIFPFFGYGLGKTLVTGVQRSSAYGEIIILSVFAGSLQGIKNFKKAGYISLIISGVVISVCLLAITLSFPYYVAREITSPMYEMTALIDYGRFFSRIDPLFLLIWILSNMISVSALFYCSISCYCKLFKIDRLRPLILPFAIIAFCVTAMPRDVITVVTGWVQVSRQYGWSIFFMLPLIALIIAAIRKKGVTENS